jgi:hypothetical protein
MLRACPSGGSSGLDWASRPYADKVPEPVGVWTIDTVNVYFDDTKIYGATQSYAWVKDWSTSFISTLLPYLVTTSADYGVNFEIVNSPDDANVIIRLYCQEWTKTGSTGGDNGYDKFVYNGKIISSYAPGNGTNYNGVVYANVKNKVYRGAEVYLNVYTIMQVRRDYEAAGNPDWEAAAKGLLFKVTGHEWGHVLGLNDDLSFTTPGWMVRKAMTDYFNDYERATLEFMYD